MYTICIYYIYINTLHHQLHRSNRFQIYNNQGPHQALLPGHIVYTICQGSSDPYYIITIYMKWVTTSWTYSMQIDKTVCHRIIFVRPSL